MLNGTSSFDDLCEFAIQFLLSRQGTAKALALFLARKTPESSALELIFILSLAASGIEEVFGSAEIDAISAEAWRVSALVGVDLHMMKCRGMPHASCADLLHYWQTVDSFFLN